MSGKQYRSDQMTHSVASDLGLHCSDLSVRIPRISYKIWKYYKLSGGGGGDAYTFKGIK